jgi:hypothetical protein
MKRNELTELSAFATVAEVSRLIGQVGPSPPQTTQANFAGQVVIGERMA